MVVDVEYINNRAIRILGDFTCARLSRCDPRILRAFGGLHLFGGTELEAKGGSHPVAILVDPPAKRTGPAALVVTSPGAATDKAIQK